MGKPKKPTEAVKNLKVDRSEFDAAMRQLLAAKPVRAEDLKQSARSK